MNHKARIAVIGGGSWGTALVKLLTNNQDTVSWWVRKKETAKQIMKFRRNPDYLRYLELDTSKLEISTDLTEVIRNADLLIFAIPAAYLRESLEKISPGAFTNKIVVSAIKGMIPHENQVVSEFFQQRFNVDPSNFGVIAGPCHSEEVAMEKLSFLTIAFSDPEKAEFLIDKLSCRYMKISHTPDIYGTEYAAVLKNIIAIANGICLGLGYGDNFQSVLIVNAIQEVKRFLEKINFVKRDINSSVYVGDLIVTAYSQFSRNRTFGNMIGKGYSVKFARYDMKMVAEGYFAVKGIHELNTKLGVDMPIMEAVYNILYENISPAVEMKMLSEKLN